MSGVSRSAGASRHEGRDSLKSVNPEHRSDCQKLYNNLKSLGYEYSMYNCYDAYKENACSIEQAINAILDGRYQPWQEVQQSKRQGTGERGHRGNTGKVVLTLKRETTGQAQETAAAGKPPAPPPAQRPKPVQPRPQDDPINIIVSESSDSDEKPSVEQPHKPEPKKRQPKKYTPPREQQESVNITSAQGEAPPGAMPQAFVQPAPNAAMPPYPQGQVPVQYAAPMPFPQQQFYPQTAQQMPMPMPMPMPVVMYPGQPQQYPCYNPYPMVQMYPAQGGQVMYVPVPWSQPVQK